MVSQNEIGKTIKFEEWFFGVKILDITYHYLRVGSPYPERRSIYLYPKILDVEGLKELMILIESKLNELQEKQQFYCKFCEQKAKSYYQELKEYKIICGNCNNEVDFQVFINNNIVSRKIDKCQNCGEDYSYYSIDEYVVKCYRHITFEQGTSIYLSNYDINIIATISGKDFAIKMTYGQNRWDLYVNNDYAILIRPSGLTFKASLTSLNGKASSYAKCLTFVLNHLRVIQSILLGNKEHLQVGSIYITTTQYS